VVGSVVSQSCYPTGVSVINLATGFWWQIADQQALSICGVYGQNFWAGYVDNMPQWYMPHDTMVHFMVQGTNNGAPFVLMIGESSSVPGQYFVMPFTRFTVFSEMKEIHPDGAIMVPFGILNPILGI
jgi:hypothetical protein